MDRRRHERVLHRGIRMPVVLRSRTALFLAACAALLAGALFCAGCSQQSSKTTTDVSAQPLDGGTFRMEQDPPDRLDPACVDDAYEAFFVNQIFDGLLAFDPHLNTVPAIAASWIIEPDGTVYTFDLKPGIRFHDGTEVTGEDVVFSLTRVFDIPAEQSGLARQYLCHILGATEYAAKRAQTIRGLEAGSNRQVRITLEHPYAPFLAVLASEMARIVPKHVVERLGDEEFARHPVGTGPFQLVQWTKDREMVLTAFRTPQSPAVHLDSLIVGFPTGNVRDCAADCFLKGQLSAVVVPVGRLGEFLGRDSSQVLSRQELSSTFIALNPHVKPFQDTRVRQAFAATLDRAAILRAHPSAHIPPNGILPPGMPGYTPESKLIARDIEQARHLLATACYPDGRGLPPVELTFAQTSEQGRAVYAMVRDQLATVGFEIVLEELPWRAFSASLQRGDMQCLAVTWTADIPDPDSFLFPMCDSEGSGNFLHYSNAKVDALLLRGRGTRSSMERLEIYRDAERRTLQDAAIIPLYHPLSAIAIQNNVRGFTLSAMGWASMPLEQVWLANAPRHADEVAAQMSAARPAASAPAVAHRARPPAPALQGRVP